MTSSEDISRWFDLGVAKGATHLIVVCDSFSYEDYPVFVVSGQDPHRVANEYSSNMQRVMEVYNLHLPKGEQVNSGKRCWNW